SRQVGPRSEGRRPCPAHPAWRGGGRQARGSGEPRYGRRREVCRRVQRSHGRTRGDLQHGHLHLRRRVARLHRRGRGGLTVRRTITTIALAAALLVPGSLAASADAPDVDGLDFTIEVRAPAGIAGRAPVFAAPSHAAPPITTLNPETFYPASPQV